MSTPPQLSGSQSDEDILKSLTDAPIGVVADALLKLGLRGMAAGLWPLEFCRGRKFAGRARTMRYLPERGVKGRKPLHYEIVDTLEPGEVLVVDGQGADLVFVGDNIARMAGNRGAVGLVVDGYVRDHQGLEQAGVPILARGLGVKLNNGYFELVDHDVPVTCGGVQVRPGDIVIAEKDGAVVVAQEMRRQVAATVIEVLPMEAELERAVLENRSLDEIREIMARRTAPK